MSTDEPTNIVHLAAVNNTTGAPAAKDLVVKFLREWADSIESGETEAEKAVLVLYHDDRGKRFIVRTRCCNNNLIEQLGMLQVAADDICCSSVEDDEDNLHGA